MKNTLFYTFSNIEQFQLYLKNFMISESCLDNIKDENFFGKIILLNENYAKKYGFSVGDCVWLKSSISLNPLNYSSVGFDYSQYYNDIFSNNNHINEIPLLNVSIELKNEIINILRIDKNIYLIAGLFTANDIICKKIQRF